MAERDRDRDRLQPHQLQVHPQHPYEGGRYGAGKGSKHMTGERGPSVTKLLAVLSSLPIGGSLLGLSGIILLGTLIGLAVTTPLLIIFSPVIIPAAIVIGLAVTGFLASGAFGLTALTSLSWVLNYIRQSGIVPEHADMAKRRMQETAGYVGQKTKDVGQQVQNKAQEGRTGEGRT